MNVRHAAALALAGWYLLVPPRESENSAKLRYDVPLGEWVYVNSFDTAKECTDDAVKEEQLREKDPLEADQYASWQCIATDDPRLR